MVKNKEKSRKDQKTEKDGDEGEQKPVESSKKEHTGLVLHSKNT